jgi:dsDNA-specific endonuclease/ATPase MutS2
VQNQDPFRLPIDGTLDLHAFAPRDVSSVVEEYLNEAHAAGLAEVRLIHGRGMGVQRGIVQRVLERHPLVVEFFDDGSSHLGATIAILRPAASPNGEHFE